MHSRIALRALAVSLLLAGAAACGGSDRSSAPTTTLVGHRLLAPAEASALLKSPPAPLTIVDVRTPDEFAAGHLAGAIEIDLNGPSFATEVAKLDRNGVYFVYCHSGHRSATAVAYLQQAGFTSIYELQGGIVAWQRAGLPVTTA